VKISQLFASLFSKRTPQPAPQPRRTSRKETPARVEIATPVEADNENRPKSTKWLSPEEAAVELVRNPSGELNFRVEEREGSLRFVSCTSGKMPSKGSPPLAKLSIFYFGVRGHQHYQPVRRKLGSLVILRREPDNPYGASAIAVVNPSTNKTYGYVNKGNSGRLSKRIDAGEDFVAVVMGASGHHLAIMPRDVASELELV
jgi:hypothetical protein